MTVLREKIAAVPQALRPHTVAVLGQLEDEQPALMEQLAASPLAASLPRLIVASEYALGVLRRLPELALQLLETNRLTQGATIDARLELDRETPERAFALELRRIRQREMLGIAWRDLCGVSTTDDTLAQVSELADELIGQASRFVQEAMAPGAQPPLILAMGKLGGGELNFSSDVDLIFLYPEEDPHGPQFYTRHAQRVIALLDARSELGFVFRVDTRLRPFGKSGAITLSLDAFENYLQTHGREWERYAYIKARALTGTPAARERLMTALRGFVYRRYLDYGLFESLRDMKTLIEEDVTRRSVMSDIKRGDGGIREIEFIVQALQIIRGGRQTQLQTPSLRTAMATLATLGHLTATTAEELSRAYGFLRRLENRLQMWRDGQTHVLPEGDDERLRLAFSMDCADWPALDTQIRATRERVSARFASLLGAPEAPQMHTLGYRLWYALIDEMDVAQALVEAGVAAPDGVMAGLARLRRARSIAHLDRHGRRRLDRLMPTVIDRAALRGDGGTVFPRVVEIIEGVGRRSAYFALLNENPKALANLIDLCSRSINIARQVAVNPLLLDNLIDPGVVTLPTPAQRTAQLQAELRDLPRDDLEILIETLAQFKHTAHFEVAVADLSEALPVMKVSDHLTSTAETILREVLVAARGWLRERHGEPLLALGAEAGFVVVAYGKLGGLELGYGSDLDLVFVYDCGGADPPTSGPRAVVSSVYFARLVQRFVHIAGAPTRFGSLYDVDMRLRPSGNSGPLVTNVDAFERYQSGSAWTWEHQALLRARVVAGDGALARRFTKMRGRLLRHDRDLVTLRADIVAMRKRLRAAHHVKERGRFDLKFGAGGLLDTEFLIQYWLLRHAHQHPTLIEYSDHMRQLDALVAVGVVDVRIGRRVQETYLDYRTALHRLALLGEPRSVHDDRFNDGRAHIRTLWRQHLAGGVEE